MADQRSIIEFVVLFVAFALAMWGIIIYNTLTQQAAAAYKAWGDLIAEFRRRLDVVEQLAVIVQSFAGRERAVFSEIEELRAGKLTSNDPAERLPAENAFAQTIKVLLALASSYEAVLANQQYADVIAELTAVEEDLIAAGRRYVGMAGSYNLLVTPFPNRLLAERLKMQPMFMLQVQTATEGLTV